MEDNADNEFCDQVDEIDEEEEEDKEDSEENMQDSWFRNKNAVVVNFLAEFYIQLNTEDSHVRQQMENGVARFPVGNQSNKLFQDVRFNFKEPSPELFYQKEVSFLFDFINRSKRFTFTSLIFSFLIVLSPAIIASSPHLLEEEFP